MFFAGNNSEDEGPSAAKVLKTDQEDATKEPQEKSDSIELDSDEGDSGEFDSEDGRLIGPMNTRSESKPYSSVTHKCEVRNGDSERQNSVVGGVIRRDNKSKITSTI